MILDENWENIKKRVIIPLWKGKFKSMYESAKLDYDDFESLAGLELSKAIKTFDASKSNIFTFAGRVVTQKAYSELRDCTRRDKRKVLHIADSIDAPDSKTYCLKKEENEVSELSEIRTGNFINSLNNNQLRFLILTLLDFNLSEIAEMLGCSGTTVRDIINSLKKTDITRVLYRRNF